MAMAYFSRYDGPVAEADDPYGSIPSNGQDFLYHIQAVEMLPNDPNTIKQSIMEGGTVTTSIRVASEFYVAENNALYYNGTDSPNHAVAIVGWDDHFDKNLFANTPEGDGAWIIQNSWGEDSGEYGFFFLSYYDTYSGNDVTAFHNAEATNNYGQVYQYDYLRTTNTLSYYRAHTPSAWGANIFTPSANQNLTAISSYAVNFDTDLEISIYTGLTDKNNPQSGKLVATQSAHFDNMGYYTIPLNTPVILTAFEPYSVVIEYSSPGNAPAVPVESPLKGYSSAAWAHPGESFITDDGKEDMLWTDVSADNINVCIKAFTEYSEHASNSINCAYRTHVENSGWMGWAKDGESAGTQGLGYRLEAIEIQVVPKDTIFDTGNSSAFIHN